MRAVLTFLLVYGVKLFSRAFYRLDVEWVGDPGDDPWSRLRAAAFLNHTSLWEVLFFAALPNQVLWRFARHGVVPGADKTLNRPVVGLFFRLFAHRVVSITRRRDHTWTEFMDVLGDDSLVVMAPEGRMKRPSGFDLQGNPMTVRGGIADVLEVLGSGDLLIAYSGGLHHVQAPGEALPRLFKTIRLRLEVLDIAAYLREMGFASDISDEAMAAFKKNVIRDLEARRDRWCPMETPGATESRDG